MRRTARAGLMLGLVGAGLAAWPAAAPAHYDEACGVYPWAPRVQDGRITGAALGSCEDRVGPRHYQHQLSCTTALLYRRRADGSWEGVSAEGIKTCAYNAHGAQDSTFSGPGFCGPGTRFAGVFRVWARFTAHNERGEKKHDKTANGPAVRINC